MSNPWYPWYPGDYRRDTSHLTQGQHGAYRLLLDHYYSTGEPLPCLEQCLRITCSYDDKEKAATKFVLESFFTKNSDGTFSNKKAEKVIVEQDKKRTSAKEKAANAANARWNKNAPSMPEALPEGVLEQCQPELDPELDLKPPPNPKPCSLKKEPKTSCDDPSDDHGQKVSDESLDAASTMADLVLKNNPKDFRLQGKKYHATYARWAEDIDKIHRINGYSWEQINYVIGWCQGDSFWMGNIRSGSKLRAQFDALVVKIKAEKEPAGGGSGQGNWGANEELN